MFLNFELPPLLYYIRSGIGVFAPGQLHMHNKRAEFFDILFVFEGKMFIWEDGQEHAISQGEFLILKPDTEHYGSRPYHESTLYYWLHFQATGNFFQTVEQQQFMAVTGHKNLLSLPKKGAILHAHLILEQLKELDNLRSYSNIINKHEQQIIFQQLIAKLSYHNNDTPSHQVDNVAKETACYLEHNFRQEISYQQLSQYFNFTSTYITRCFKKIYQMTPLDYLNKIRLEEAKFHLRNTDFTVVQIAFDVGFNSNSYFSRLFAKEFGMSPLQYRKFHQKPL